MLKKILFHIKWRLDNIGFFDSWSDETYLKFVYRFRVGRKLDLHNPKTFNEKIQWLKLYDRNPAYTKMVDKALVKSYVADLIGEQYIIPTYGVYEKFDDIDFSVLPKRFVMKCTHNSGGVVVVDNKDNIDVMQLKERFDKLLKKQFYYVGREWPYKDVKPQIIIEENIQEEASEEQISDYKLMCFNGEVKCSFVCSNRNSKSGLCVNFYDEHWEPMPFERHYPRNLIEIPKPSMYDEMVRLAEILSRNIPFVRVDFYQKNEKIYFGELTFYPGSGVEEFSPEIWDYKLGEWMTLPKTNK